MDEKRVILSRIVRERKLTRMKTKKKPPAAVA